MNQKIGVVDLFSGPGGLGEGFSTFSTPDGNKPFKIELSVEKEPSAHATLTLRSFLRKFENGFPDEYYDFLNGDTEEPDWEKLYPDHWAEAQHEAILMELGHPETAAVVNKRLEEIKAQYGGNTVLIGGPPCQAYSLVGRSRNAGKADYHPHEDERHFLYQEYVNVLSNLQPALFVMENVKGMLSSAVKGDRIFQQVMLDLQSAGGDDSYRLLSLSDSNNQQTDWVMPSPSEFIVRAEDYGVPQARHRVIIVGVRKDILLSSNSLAETALTKVDVQATVCHVLGSLPKLRSGLSRKDTPESWYTSVAKAIVLLDSCANLPETLDQHQFRQALAELKRQYAEFPDLDRTNTSGTKLHEECIQDLRLWLEDPKLKRLPNHETRGHMASDLGRYMYAAIFGNLVGRSPKAIEFPQELAPNHKNWDTGKFADRFRVQIADRPATTVTSHISKDGHYFIHPDALQCRSLTVREAARLQTFPDNYFFKGNRTEQYVQVGNAVPPYLARLIAMKLYSYFVSKH
ncbi:DNA cytosine methyltransferase [Thalassospira sp. ER-Se-21-Dark]|uniref:DNA cytosine methyltransferase n=1 Tax=Thalassospira sp. ER-Se-21-Dark TaxID=2585190 RepID=UPI001B30F87F|nr:DNA cytosine methyltransferase [Thalassospira sp. ER-Se-21-Dark]MBP3127365.1 DNA cytosine methyltransferase [Thalassospira sp. ER-Se-21-Dark]